MSSDFMRQIVSITALCLVLAATAGCPGFTEKIPGVYRIDIQQGNVIEQEMLDQLERGMDKSQVRFIMGTPMLIDPFNSNRWEYVYTYKRGVRVREQRHISLHFDENEQLSHLSGDIKPGDGMRYLAEEDRVMPERTIEVPEGRSRGGLFGWFRGSSRVDRQPAPDADEERALENIEVIEEVGDEISGGEL
jgi:outer membrane protein assembly factor BamE